VHAGFKPIMPSYQGLLDAAEVGALVEYIRSLRDVERYQGEEPAPVSVPGSVPLVTPLIPEGTP
jgi:cytochrome c oxidase subunit II